jgi:hypothetical protein
MRRLSHRIILRPCKNFSSHLITSASQLNSLPPHYLYPLSLLLRSCLSATFCYLAPQACCFTRYVFSLPFLPRSSLPSYSPCFNLSSCTYRFSPHSPCTRSANYFSFLIFILVCKSYTSCNIIHKDKITLSHFLFVPVFSSIGHSPKYIKQYVKIIFTRM